MVLIALSVCVTLVLGLMPSATSNLGRKAPARAAEPGIRKANIKPSATSNKLASIIAARIASASDGQTSTLLPDGRVLVIGGEDADGPTASVAIKDPRTNETVALTKGLTYARAWHTATLLPDGTVLILGGVGADGQTVARPELFNLETQAFEVLSPTSLMPRAYHTATLLTDGRVLIAGGLSAQAKALRQAELWNYRSRTSEVLAGKLKTARYSHTATLLPDGDVLFASGASNEGVALSDGEVFSATARRFNRSQAFAIQPETDAPRLEAALPADGALDVPLDALLAVRFSTLLRVDSVHAGSVTLSGPAGAVAVKVVPAEAGMLAFVTPKELLLPGATYTLSLMGLSDTAMRALSFASVSFTTGQTLTAPAANDQEEWRPTAGNFQDNWQTGRAKSPWQALPSLQAAPGVTAVAGQALTLNGQPLKHVTLKVNDQTAQTDHTGRFLLTEVVAGHQFFVLVDRQDNFATHTFK